MLCYLFSTNYSYPDYAIPLLRKYIEETLGGINFDFAFFFNTHRVSDARSIYKYLRFHFGTENNYVFFQIPYFATDRTFLKDGFGAIVFKFENPKTKVYLEKFFLKNIESIFSYVERVRKLNVKLFHLIILTNVERFIAYLIPHLKRENFTLKYPLFGWVSGTHDWNDGSFIITNRGILKSDEFLLIRFENFETYTEFAYNLKVLTTGFKFKAESPLKITEIENENPSHLLAKYMETIRENKENIIFFPILITSSHSKCCYLRYPKRLEKDGLVIWGDVPKEGEFAFINQYDVVEMIKEFLTKELEQKLPQWDFIIGANCVGKGLFVDPKKEIEAFEKYTRKPYAIFGTLGEINTVNRQPFLLNGSLNLLAIKEIVEE